MTARLADPDPLGCRVVNGTLVPAPITPADVKRAIEIERAWQMRDDHDEKEAA